MPSLPNQPQHLVDVLALAKLQNYNLVQTANTVHDFLSSKFKSHLTGVPNFDIPLKKLFESITGHELK